MRRGDFIKELVNAGCYLKRHGSKHDIYANPRNGKQAPVPRHQEIKELLITQIKKQLDIMNVGLRLAPNPTYLAIPDFRGSL